MRGAGIFPCGIFLIFAGILLFISVASASFPARSGRIAFQSTSERDTVFTLPAIWVEFDSVKVYRNTELLSEFTHWRIVEPGNRIWLYRPLGRNDSLVVFFVYRPIPLFKTYSRHSLRELGREIASKDTSRILSTASPQVPTFEGWSRLNKSGSLIRSVQVGTGQDLALESALSLQIDGRVGKNIDVIAVLSDQSTPIQPEGTTESLSELEKVFVSVRSPHLATTLGDYTLNLPGGRYDNYTRKLTGVFGEANYLIGSAFGGGAVSKGEFFTNSFNGLEANQGPYPLTGRDGEIGIVVLAGTEHVWLDGERMRRGEGNDYVIDYASGEITFTTRRLITGDSRIVVDFEYANEQYERTYGAARVESRYGNDRLGGTATFISEADDRSRPLGLALTDGDKLVLSSVGDNAALAVDSTADSVGIGGGDYVTADTTTFEGNRYHIFVFSPRDSNRATGDWSVLFDDFGQGNGEYDVTATDSTNLQYFRWVGPGRGRYRPMRRLALPEKHVLEDIRLHGSPVTGLTLSGELALSQRDRNTYSANDDGDNNGAAFSGGVKFSRQRLNVLGLKPHLIEVDGAIRTRDKRFSEITRSSEIEFQREWNAAINQGTEETIRETSLRLSPIAPLMLTGGYGDLSRGSTSSSVRRNIGASYSLDQRLRLSASHLVLQSADTLANHHSRWIRQNARANGTIWRLSPRFTVDHERRRDQRRSQLDGFRFTDYSSGLGVSLPQDMTLDSEYRRRLDDRLSSEDKYRDFAHAYTLTSEATWRPASLGSVQARYAHREKKYRASDSADVINDAGRMEALLSPRNRLIEANLIYGVSKTQTQSQYLVAIQVAPGTGSYRREGDQYLPDDQGNYILAPRNTGSYAPATEISLNTLFWLRPDEASIATLSEWIKTLASETEITLEEKTRNRLSTALLLLDQSRFRGDSTLTGTVTIREDLHVRRLSRKLAVRFRYRQTNSLQNQFLNGGQERKFHEGGMRVRARYLTSLRGETEATFSRESLIYVRSSLPSRDITRFELLQENTLTFSNFWEAGLGLKGSEVNDERSRTQLSLREVRPRAAYTLIGRGRIDVDVSWIHATSNKAAIPFELGRGANRGENFIWNLRGTYQFGPNFSGSLNYSARNDAGEKTFHTGRLEARATF